MTKSSTISHACASVSTCCASLRVLLGCKYFVCACVMCMGYGRCGRWDLWIDMCVCMRVCLCGYLHVFCMYVQCGDTLVVEWYGTHNTVAHATHSDIYTHRKTRVAPYTCLSVSSTQNTPTPPPHISFTPLSSLGHTGVSRLCHNTHSKCLYRNTHKNTQHAETVMHTQSVVMVTHKQR